MQIHLIHWRPILATMSLVVAAAAAPQGLISRSSAQDQDQQQADARQESADQQQLANQRALAERQAAEAAAAEKEARAALEREIKGDAEERESREGEDRRERRGEDAERNPTRAMRDWMRQRLERTQQLQERIADLEKQIEQRRNNNEDTEELLNEVEQLRKERQGLGDIPAMPAYRLRQLQERLESLKARAKQLEEQGRLDEAAEFARDIERTTLQLDRANQQRSAESFPGQPQTSREDHLRIAIEHLRAAGMHEMAERLTQQVGGGREANRESEPRRPGEDSPNNGPRRGAGNGRDMNQYERELMRMAQKVHEEMAAMHKEIEELRAALNKNRDEDPDATEEEERAKQ